ncbi:MAG: ATP-binding cassette domain-containing protein [Erysipelotrichaceae bacterium]|nr:ATP-binding cassette domain-containing protein [Erysipelotrichaceae bacterium]
MIELRNVRKDYVMESSTVHALKGVSIAFRQNEFVAVLGPSGGGKTTLLNIIGGLDRYTEGDLLINGKTTSDYSDRQWDNYRNHSVGFVFQSYNLIPHQDVLSNVELALTISGISAAERKRRAIEALRSVGLEDQIGKRPNQLSGGQMQRVAIARAVVNDPDILLADEPTGALDTQSSLQVMEILRKVAQDRLVVMVTHNPELAEEYATRIIRIRDGEITSDSNPYRNSSEEENFTIGKARMGLLTAFKLSLNNLLSKKGRTILTAFAGSIGIIGIALILSLSTGVNNYIDEVQTNSLSSYPLSIERNTADYSSLIDSMMGTVTSTEKQEGQISEMPLVNQLFTQMGTNNLSAFHRYLIDNKETIEPLLTALQYDYGITPQIYSDRADKAVRLNPSTFSQGSYSSSYGFGMQTFQRMINNQELLESQYDVLAGRWPQKYDECLLVLNDRYTITDYQLYALGIRDPEELSKLAREAFNGQQVSIDNESMIFNYDYFLNLSFRVVVSADYYRYNKEYDVWEDMRDDESYLKQQISDGLQLKVVGIITEKDGVSASSLTPGIAYREELIDYLIDQSAGRQIVSEQLTDDQRDVFTRLSFEEANEKGRKSNLNFSDMISVDQNAIREAFGTTIDENRIRQTISGSINEALDALSTDTAETSQQVTAVFSVILDRTLRIYIEEHGIEGTASYGQDDIQAMIDAGFADPESQRVLGELADEYGMSTEMLEMMFRPLLERMLQGYLDISVNAGIQQAYLTEENLDEILNLLMNNFIMESLISQYSRALIETRMRITISQCMIRMSTELIAEIAGGISVDADKLAGAFKFDMDEDELSRLLSTYMTDDSSEVSYSRNLRLLGYRSADDPEAISFYFRDFASKDAFKQMISDYNEDMKASGAEEKVIIYTDITGILMKSITTIINAISYVLIAFVSISLVVSSIMIGIITYISVLERTKEIGILRSLGASKGDVRHVFSAETFIIGLISGLLGVGVTVLLCIPISLIVRKLTGISTITASLPYKGAIILTVISVVLTLIAGLIPSRMASKCDPVVALRSE